jgi:hypothetical protein
MSAETYLGSKPLDIATHPIFKDYAPKDWALYWIERYSSIDGAHHKTWLIDQIARILHGAPIMGKVASWTDHADEYRFSVGTCPGYGEWVIEMGGEDGDYDEGIAP